MKNFIICKIELPGKFIVTDNPTLTAQGLADSFLANTLATAHHELMLDPYSTTKMLIGGSRNFTMRKLALDPERVESFFNVYFNELEGTYTPDTHVLDINDTFNRMKWAIIENKFNKDSLALKNTLKILKIKNTYKAIQSYLKGEA